jgi:hypothetical protein
MNYKKMSYQRLQKEVFLLEHGFYDEKVAKFIQDNPSLLLGGDITSIKYCVIHYNKTIERTYPTLWVELNPDTSQPTKSNTWSMNNYQGEELLIRARRLYFEDKYGVKT